MSPGDGSPQQLLLKGPRNKGNQCMKEGNLKSVCNMYIHLHLIGICMCCVLGFITCSSVFVLLFLSVSSFLDEYYDTEDPSVNLHEFIINSLQAQK